MERTHNEEEHAHDIFVAAEGVAEGELDFGLDFVRLNWVTEEEFQEEIVVGENGENEKEEKYVMAVEEVVWSGGGVVEP